MPLAPIEQEMWEKSQSPSKIHTDLSNAEARYESREKKILTEINRERLPSFAESLNKESIWIYDLFIKEGHVGMLRNNRD